MENLSKEKLLKEIEKTLAKYDGKMEISPYVLEYLNDEELQKILDNLLQKQENVIKDNHDWLMQFKKGV
jgi:Glu-tRNA(Gln) amidotransferase subunit E-like FAD-binding protein